MSEDTFIPFQPLTVLTGLERDIAAFEEAHKIARAEQYSQARMMLNHPHGGLTKTGVWLYVVDGGQP